MFFLGGEHGQNPRRIRLPEPPGANPASDDELQNVTYDPKTHTLTSVAKGRGIGDCGSNETWLWDGKAFRLLRETEMDACRGVLIDDWPTRYVARSR